MVGCCSALVHDSCREMLDALMVRFFEDEWGVTFLV